jgi:hypothetical protein
MYAHADYRYVFDQPADATLRDNDSWVAWVIDRAHREEEILAMFDDLNEVE